VEVVGDVANLQRVEGGGFLIVEERENVGRGETAAPLPGRTHVLPCPLVGGDGDGDVLPVSLVIVGCVVVRVVEPELDQELVRSIPFDSRYLMDEGMGIDPRALRFPAPVLGPPGKVALTRDVEEENRIGGR